MDKEKRHNAYIKRKPGEIKKARQWQMDNPEKVKHYKWQFRQDKPMIHRYYNLKSKKKDKMKMTAAEFNAWYESEPKQCFYCDIPLDLLALNNRYTNHRDSHNLFTIDRKECSGDYSLENIVLACPLCNLVKSNFFSADTMRELAQRYVKPRWQRKAGIEPDALIPDIEEWVIQERLANKLKLEEAKQEYYNAGFEQGKFEEGERIICKLEQRAKDNLGKCVYWSDLQVLKGETDDKA